MPIISEEAIQRVKSQKSFVLWLVVAPLTGFSIGFGIAASMFASQDNEKYVAKILAINAMDAHWAYFTAVIYSLLTYW